MLGHRSQCVGYRERYYFIPKSYTWPQTERLGVKDFRVEPVRGDDLAKLLVPAAGIAAFALLAGQWLACKRVTYKMKRVCMLQQLRYRA